MNVRQTGLAVFAASVLAASGAEAAPRWLRLSWAGPTDTAAVVSWNDDSAGFGTVEVRLAGAGAAQTFDATNTWTGPGELGAVYQAQLMGLAPEAAYEYRVQSGGEWSGWSGFRTGPPAGSCAPLRFVALGDSRGEVVPDVIPYLPPYYQPSLQWPKIAGHVAGTAPLFVLHSGDFVRSGDQPDQWVKELPLLEPLARGVPFFMALGNHDRGPGAGAGATYNELFAFPSDNPDRVEDYFSFVAGNVLVVALSTETFSMDAQIDWLRTVLEAHRADVDWRVAFFHAPVWSSGAHGSNEYDATRADRLVPLLDEFGVDLVLNGHDHDYERFHPSRGGYGGVARAVTPLGGADQRQGIAQGTSYLVTGGGGALVNLAFTTHEEGSALGSNHLHFVLVDVRGGTMSLSVRDCGLQTSNAASCAGELERVVLEKAGTTCRAAGPDAGMPPDAAGSADAAGVDAGGPDAAGPRLDAGRADAAGGLADAAGGGHDGGAVHEPPSVAPDSCGCAQAAGGWTGLLVALAGLLSRRSRRAGGLR